LRGEPCRIDDGVGARRASGGLHEAGLAGAEALGLGRRPVDPGANARARSVRRSLVRRFLRHHPVLVHALDFTTGEARSQKPEARGQRNDSDLWLPASGFWLLVVVLQPALLLARRDERLLLLRL